MRFFKKTAALLLTLALCTTVGAGCTFDSPQKEEYPVTTTIELPPLYGDQDDLLEYNPDRGWRLEVFFNVANSTGDGMGAQPEPEMELIRALERYQKYRPQLCQVYFYLTGYKNTPVISQEGFDRMQRMFDTAKERGIKLIVRFAYESDMEGTGEAADEIMLAHMPQLTPILEKNIDVIHTVEAGFLGAWGEWHSYKLPHDELAILKGVLNMVPEALYVQVRYPRVKNVLADVEPDNPHLKRMGYHDDSFFGWQDAQWNDGLNPWEDQWEQMRKESPYGPEGGEMFWGCQYRLDLWAPTTGEMAIRKYSAFHQNSFSIYHSFIEEPYVAWAVPGAGYYSMQDWLVEPVTRQMLDTYMVAYDPIWFQNENGEEIARTAFEFVHDHLGYRLRAMVLTLDGKRECAENMRLTMSLRNTGFSAVFNMESGFAVLDQNGQVISTVAAGNPTKWLPADPETHETLYHSISAELTLPETPGTYQIAFYLKNSAGTGARLANDLQYINGYNILETVEVK